MINFFLLFWFFTSTRQNMGEDDKLLKVPLPLCSRTASGFSAPAGRSALERAPSPACPENKQTGPSLKMKLQTSKMLWVFLYLRTTEQTLWGAIVRLPVPPELLQTQSLPVQSSAALLAHLQRHVAVRNAFIIFSLPKGDENIANKRFSWKLLVNLEALGDRWSTYATRLC